MPGFGSSFWTAKAIQIRSTLPGICIILHPESTQVKACVKYETYSIFISAESYDVTLNFKEIGFHKSFYNQVLDRDWLNTVVCSRCGKTMHL